MNKFWVVLHMVSIVILVTVFAGCGDRIPGPQGAKGAPRAEKPYTNNAGQSVEKVLARDFADWLESHKNIMITSVVAVSDSTNDYNPTTHFWVIYKELP